MKSRSLSNYDSNNPPKLAPKFRLERHQPANPQTQSLFFATLPLEIRLLIYQSIINSWGWGSSLHILMAHHLEPIPPVPWVSPMYAASTSHALVNVPCAASLGDPFLISGTHYGHWRRGHLACSQIAKWRCEGSAECQGDLKFLSACQRLYEEVTDLVYPKLKFDLMGLVATERFLTSLTPSTLMKIRFLHISFRTNTIMELPGEPALSQSKSLWPGTCAILPLLKSLQDLRIAIYDNIYPTYPESPFLEHLLNVEVPNGKFVVELKSYAKELSDHGPPYRFTGPAPFVIERRAHELLEEVTVLNRGHPPSETPLAEVNRPKRWLNILFRPVHGAYRLGRGWYSATQQGS